MVTKEIKMSKMAVEISKWAVWSSIKRTVCVSSADTSYEVKSLVSTDATPLCLEHIPLRFNGMQRFEEATMLVVVLNICSG